MIRVTMLRKICIVLFTLSLAASFLLPVHAATVKDAIDNAKTKNTTLIDKFYTTNTKVTDLGVKGSYFEGSTLWNDPEWSITGPKTTDTYAEENALALMAFTARKQVENEGLMSEWAEDIGKQTFGTSGTLAQNGIPRGYVLSENQKYAYPTANPGFSLYRFAIAQFMSMEALGKYATICQDDSVTSLLRHSIRDWVYSTYLRNSSYALDFPVEPKDQMATWFSCVRSGGEVAYVSIDDPLGHDWSYPLTNVSLWAAIGFARMAITLRGTSDDDTNFWGTQSFADNCTAVAEASMLYPEIWCYNPEYGLYKEHWEDSSQVYQLRTQALAILACSRLYQASQKQFYLERADSLLAIIAKYFFVGAAGAGVSSVDLSTAGIASRSTLIDGYSNAMLAMALGDLFQVTGNYEYARLCTDIVTFFNTYLWDTTTSTVVQGYLEFLNASTLQRIPSGSYGGYPATAKLIATNSMVFFANEMVFQANKTFWDLYAFWIIIGAIVAAGVIVVVILVRRRGAVGTKLSKTVRGLITEA